MTRDRFPAHEYNKLVSHKIGPLDVEKINPNAYRLRLRTSYVFNVKHLVPYVGENSIGYETAPDSRANPFQEGENDGDETVPTKFD